MGRAGLPQTARTASQHEVERSLGNPADRALGYVRDSGGFIADMQWWVVRTEPGEQFLLGDTPTTAAVALGHAEAFLPLLGSASYVVAMPLHPEVALLATRLPALPISGNDVDLVGSVNRMSWLWAEEYVVASREDDLLATRDALDSQARNRTITAPFDRTALRVRVSADVASVLAGSGWRPYARVCPSSGVGAASLLQFISRTHRLPILE